MDTNKLKKFAVEARNKIKAGVEAKLSTLGFDAKGNVPDSMKPQLMQGGSLWNGQLMTEGFYHQWMALYDAVKRHGVRDVYEEAAYTWFNRLVAIRILQKNGLISPVLTYADAARTPQIVDDARSLNRIPPMPEADRQRLMELLDDDTKVTEQFAILITAYCHDNPIIRKSFGRMADYTELLLPNNILAENGFIDDLNRMSSESNDELAQSLPSREGGRPEANHTEFITDEDYKSSELIGWLYQFYISERKDEVFAKKGKYDADEIAPATQIFTPHWIVEYMVQNTIGRIYLDNHPEASADFSSKWKYLVGGDASRVTKTDKSSCDAGRVASFAELTDLRFADLGCGSGHILGYMFDILFDLYIYEGYTRKEAVENILRYNITGVDIDLRAKQLATFALLLKACQKDESFRDGAVLPHVLTMPEPIAEADRHQLFHEFFQGEETNNILAELDDAFDLLKDAQTLGSIMKFDLSKSTLLAIRQTMDYWKDQSIVPDSVTRLLPSFRIILALTQKYTALVMNPPYMGSGRFDSVLSKYVKDNYPAGKADLFSVFMLVAKDRLVPNGKYAMINMQSWMFLSSFEQLRKDLLDTMQIDSMLHLGPHTFDELSGEVVQNTAFVVGGDASRVTEPNVASRNDNHRKEDCDARRVVSYVTKPTIPSRNDNHRKGDCDARRVASYLNKKEYVSIGYGKLPHWYQPGKTQFVTFRLADSLPQTKLQELNDLKNQWLKEIPEPWTQPVQEKYDHEIRVRVDKWLDQGMGSCILAKKEIRKIVEDALSYYDGVKYALHDYVIMPNHVHLLLTPLVDEEPNKIVGSVKTFTAHAINKALGQEGSVWQREVFDRIVRDEDNFEQYVNYIDNNPKNLTAGMFSLGGDASRVAKANANALRKDHGEAERLDDCDAGRVASYYRLVDGKNCADKERMFLENRDGNVNGAKVYYPNVKQKDFEKIPGCPIGYWVSQKIFSAFGGNLALSAVCRPTQGLATADNARFLRYWTEVNVRKSSCFSNSLEDIYSKKWIPTTKGGTFRKWYGNITYVVNWENDGEELRNFNGSVIRNPGLYFKKSGCTWSTIASGKPSFRYFDKHWLFETKGSVCFPNNESENNIIMGYLNSSVIISFLQVLSPTLDYHEGPMGRVPYKNVADTETVNTIVSNNITLSKLDWDAHETSWDFAENPLVAIMKEATRPASQTDGFATETSHYPAEAADDHGVVSPLPKRGNDVAKAWYDDYHGAVTELGRLSGEGATPMGALGSTTRDASAPMGTLELCVNAFESLWTARFMQLHANEEELNRQFIDIYGLQDELTPDVPLNEITILQQGEISIE